MFKAGDVVKIIRKPTEVEKRDWNNTWNFEMDKAVGQTGKFVKDCGSIGCSVEVNSLSRKFFYPECVLELFVEPVKVAPVNQLVAATDPSKLEKDPVLAAKFNVGDKVCVYYQDFQSLRHGTTATVVPYVSYCSLSNDGFVRVKFNDGVEYNVYPQRLTLIESPATITAPEPVTVPTRNLVATTVASKLGRDSALASQFKIGDTVRISFPDYLSHNQNKTGTVIGTSEYVQVRMEDGSTPNYYPQRLTLIETPAPVSSGVSQAGTPPPIVKPNLGKRRINSKSAVFIKALEIALTLGHEQTFVDADDVQEKLSLLGYKSTDLGNAAGCLFRSKQWKKVGTTKSVRPGNHLREITTWTLVK